MDFVNLVADVTKILPVHYSNGRGGKPVSFVGIHYNYGDLTVEQCYNIWLTREASAHYQVESNGRTGQLVWDRDTAWALGNFDKNQRSINIEHANLPDGTITETCLDVGSHLTAAICVKYGLGRPEWMKNVIPHKAISPTSCPGEIYGKQKDAYIQRAQYWYDVMTGVIEEDEMTNEERNMLKAIYTEVMRTDDPSGRNVISKDHDHIKWIAKAITDGFDKMTNLLNDILKKLDGKEPADV